MLDRAEPGTYHVSAMKEEETTYKPGRIAIVGGDEKSRSFLLEVFRTSAEPVLEVKSVSSLPEIGEEVEVAVICAVHSADDDEICSFADGRVPTIVAIVCCGPATTPSVKTCLERGVADYIAFPSDSDTVFARVLAALHRKRAQDLQMEEQKLIERIKKELQSAFDTLNESVYIVNPSYQLLRANRATLKMYDKKSFDEIIGKTCYRALYGLDGPCAKCPAAECFGGEDQCEREVLEYTPLGKRELRKRAINMENRTTAVVLVEDVTRQKELARREAHARETENLARLARAVAHEINQPLGAVSGRAQLLLLALNDPDNVDAEAIKADAEAVVENCWRVSNIVKKLFRITDVVVKPYLDDTTMLDIDRSSGG